MDSPLLVERKAYEFLLWTMKKTEGFPRTKRASLGQRMDNLILEVVLELSHWRFAGDKRALLGRAGVRFDEFKFCLRIAHDLALLSHDSFAHAAEHCASIGKMMGGLIKNRYKQAP